MDNELVTSSESEKNTKVGGGISHQPTFFRYGETFDKLCGFYMSIGMSYSDYWDGDNELPKFYRDKMEYERNRDNERLWLQGFYVYEAILDCIPVLNPFSKEKQPRPYRDSPIPLSEAQSKASKEAENKKKLRQGQETMRRIMASVNKKFEERGKKNG